MNTNTIQLMFPGMPIAGDPVARLMNMASQAAEFGDTTPIELDGFKATVSFEEMLTPKLDARALVARVDVVDLENDFVVQTKSFEV